MRTRPLRELADRLAAEGPCGTFARYLLALGPDVEVPVAGDVFAVGGATHGRFEARFAWLFGSDPDEVGALLDSIDPRYAYVRPGLIDALRARPTGSPGRRFGEDLLLTGEGAIPPRGPGRTIRIGAGSPLDRIHEDIARTLPPPPIWDRFQFDYRGLEIDGQVVATLEITVTDSRWTVIQQVLTPPDLRGRGYGRRLVTDVCAELLALGRIPLWLCAADNEASEALARSAGFRLHARIGCLERA